MFSNRLGLFLINVDKIFPMKSSEFTKSMYFGSHLKNKSGTTFSKKKISLKNVFFYGQKDLFLNQKVLILIDLNQIFTIKSLKFGICYPIESYEKKNAENGRNLNVAKKCTVSKL